MTTAKQRHNQNDVPVLEHRGRTVPLVANDNGEALFVLSDAQRAALVDVLADLFVAELLAERSKEQ